MAKGKKNHWYNEDDNGPPVETKNFKYKYAYTGNFCGH